MKLAAASAALALAACSPGAALRPQLPPMSDIGQSRAADGATFTEDVVYNFRLNARRRSPLFPAGLLLPGQKGNFYGTTSATAGFRGGAGTVYELTRDRSLRVLSRTARREGSLPLWGVARGRGRGLFGATLEGGDLDCLGGLGCGTVFKLKPAGSEFQKETLHRFSGRSDGAEPSSGLTLDSRGTLYGTTGLGGGTGCAGRGCGIVYKFTPAGQRYDETVVYRFRGGADGSTPAGGVVLDPAGNLYGVTTRGGISCFESDAGCGTVYELVPRRAGFKKIVLYRFRGSAVGDGAFPAPTLTRRPDGRLYGATLGGGTGSCLYGGCGTVFELVPSGATYRERVLLSFDPARGRVPPGPSGLLLRQRQNELYGTTSAGGRFTSYFFPHGCGTAFVIYLPSGSSRVIHEFKGPPEDGAAPTDGVIEGPGDALYGATARGGTGECLGFSGCGTIFRLALLRPPSQGPPGGRPEAGWAPVRKWRNW
ncbi:MAG TPA: choice-of-anchor tandem repeat GloVer-containing protein [Candidatus Binatia bacterium]|nr:choice-of-anchor tandem repeat GloVer-containing protein [Candidatus Binatia bacterium]